MRISAKAAASIRAGIMKARASEWLGPQLTWLGLTRDDLAFAAYMRYERKYWERRCAREDHAMARAMATLGEEDDMCQDHHWCECPRTVCKCGKTVCAICGAVKEDD